MIHRSKNGAGKVECRIRARWRLRCYLRSTSSRKDNIDQRVLEKENSLLLPCNRRIGISKHETFSGRCCSYDEKQLLQKAVFTDWLDLFQVIADYEPDKKKVLVIDEFPYLVKINSAFPSILQNAWDEILKDSNVMLILSGSLIGMMQKHALSYDSPLYGVEQRRCDWLHCHLQMFMMRLHCLLIK